MLEKEEEFYNTSVHEVRDNDYNEVEVYSYDDDHFVHVDY